MMGQLAAVCKIPVFLMCVMGMIFGLGVIMTKSAVAAEQATGGESARVMAQFAQGDDTGAVVKIADKTKQIVMFSMGIALLLFVLATAYFGVSMVIFGKQVFVRHMVCAGLSVTLAIAHAVVALVWFFPF